MAVDSGFYWDESFVCSTAASLNALQYYIVNSTGVGGVAGSSLAVGLCTSATAGPGVNNPIGVLQNDPKNNPQQAAIVRLLGISKVVATTSAAVNYGDLITCTTGGQAMTADTVGQPILGRCIAGSTTLVSGALIEVLIAPSVMSHRSS